MTFLTFSHVLPSCQVLIVHMKYLIPDDGPYLKCCISVQLHADSVGISYTPVCLVCIRQHLILHQKCPNLISILTLNSLSTCPLRGWTRLNWTDWTFALVPHALVSLVRLGNKAFNNRTSLLQVYNLTLQYSKCYICATQNDECDCSSLHEFTFSVLFLTQSLFLFETSNI